MISGRRTGIAPSARRWDIHMQRFRSASLLLLAVHVPLVLSYLAAPTPAARRSDIGCPRRCTAPEAAFAAFEPPDHSLVLKDALMKKAVGRQMEAFKSVGDTALQLWLKSKWDSFSSMEHETGCTPARPRSALRLAALCGPSPFPPETRSGPPPRLCIDTPPTPRALSRSLLTLSEKHEHFPWAVQEAGALSGGAAARAPYQAVRADAFLQAGFPK